MLTSQNVLGSGIFVSIFRTRLRKIGNIYYICDKIPQLNHLQYGAFFISLVESLSQLTLCDLMDCSIPCLPVHHQLPEFTQTHIR